MSILKRISNFLSSASNIEDKYADWISVQCSRCGEIIHARIDLRNDLSIDYGDKTTYHCRKILIGEKRCFQRVEVNLIYDENRRLIDTQVTGGKLVENPKT